MKRRNKIIATITTISLALTMLVIGVVASTSRTFSITGNIAYIVEDVMCNITTSLFCTDNNILSTDAELYNEMYKLTDTALDINSASVSLPTGIVKSARFDAVTKSTYNQATDTYASNEQLNVDNIALVMGKYDSSVAASDRESFAYYIAIEIENFATNTISVSITPNVANSSIENLRTMMTSSNFQIQGLETKRVVFAVSIDEITRNIDLSNLNWTVELKNVGKPELKVETIHKNTELADIPLVTETINISTELVTLAEGNGLVTFSIEDIPSGYNNLHLSLTDTNNTVFSECIGIYVDSVEQLPTDIQSAFSMVENITDYSKVCITTNVGNIYMPSENVYFFMIIMGFDSTLTETTITAEKTLTSLYRNETTGTELVIEDCFVDTIMNMPMVLVNCTLENISAGSLTIEVPSAMMVMGAVLPEGTSFPINVAQAYPLLMMIGEESMFEGEQLVAVPLSSKYADNSISFSFIVVGEFTEESTDISSSASYGEGQTASSSKYNYSLQTINNKQGYVITGYSGEDTNIVVPTYFVDESTNTAYDVIGINGAFSWKNIQTIVLPDTLLSIGDYAFNHCQQLSRIEIPESVTSIGDYAFLDCIGLKCELLLPEGLTSIGSSAFYNCTGLTSIDLGSVTEIGSNVFGYCTTLESIVIPESVKSIGSSAFSNCTGLISIDLGSVETISQSAFSNCSALISVVIPDTMTSIEYNVFSNCTSLQSITIPSSVTNINSAFSGCTGVKELNYNSSISYSFGSNFGSSEGLNVIIGKDGDSTSISIPTRMYYQKTNIKTLVLKNNVTSIGSFAFSGCTGLTSINLGSVTEIGPSAFYNCTGLTSVELGGVSEISPSTFSGCTGLTSVELGGVSEISSYAFSNCTGLTSIDLGDVTIIGDRAFFSCTGLTSIDLENVTSIGSSAFYSCTGLTSIDLENVTSIGSSAFSGCTGLTSIDLGNVTSIGSKAFQYTNLTEITIPSSITSVSNVSSSLTNSKIVQVTNNSNLEITLNDLGIQYGCPGTEINKTGAFTNTLNKAGKYTTYIVGNKTYLMGFNNPTQETNANDIPSSVTGIYNYAFYGLDNLISLIIPDNVTQIGEYAFSHCEGLTTLDLNNVEDVGYNAFSSCTGLVTLDLGNVVSIRPYGFSNCTGLTGELVIPETLVSILSEAFSWTGFTSIVVDENNPYYTSKMNGVETNCIIDKDTTNNIYSLIQGCKNSIIAEGITSISSDAFFGIDNLTSVTIPDSVTSIGSYAFAYCSALTSIDLNNVQSIGSYAFWDLTEMKSITIPDCVVSIGSKAFCNWEQDQSIYFEGTSYPENLNTGWNEGCYAKIYLNGVLQN